MRIPFFSRSLAILVCLAIHASLHAGQYGVDHPVRGVYSHKAAKTVASEDSKSTDTIIRELLASAKKENAEWRTSELGVRTVDLYAGRSEPPLKGDRIFLHLRVYDQSGRKLVDTFAWRFPYVNFAGFMLIKELDEAVGDMREGGKRLAIVPAAPFIEREFFGFELLEIPPESSLLLEANMLYIRHPDPNRREAFNYGQEVTLSEREQFEREKEQFEREQRETAAEPVAIGQ